MISSQEMTFRDLIKNIIHSEEDWLYEQFAKPSRRKIELIPELADKVKGVTVQTQDNLNLQYFDINFGESKNYVIFFHGVNVGALEEQQQTLYKDLTDKGINVLAVEYRGFGPNKGKVDEEGFTKDAISAYEYLIKKGIEPQNIGLVGHSLGGAVACKLASQKDVCFLVLDSSFNNVIDGGKAALKAKNLKYNVSLRQGFDMWLLTSGLTQPKNRFENDIRIKEVKAPVLFIHCENDDFVPIKLAKKLYGQIKERSEFITIENCDIHEITPMESCEISQYASRQFNLENCAV